jgi:hypothetical protein
VVVHLLTEQVGQSKVASLLDGRHARVVDVVAPLDVPVPLDALLEDDLDVALIQVEEAPSRIPFARDLAVVNHLSRGYSDLVKLMDQPQYEVFREVILEETYLVEDLALILQQQINL